MTIEGYLAIGAGIALLGTAPVGPATSLCINRTLGSGIVAGVLAGIGATVSLLACAAATLWAVRMIGPSLLHYEPMFRWIGALLVVTTTVRLLVQRRVPDWLSVAGARSPLINVTSSLIFNASYHALLMPALAALAVGVGLSFPGSADLPNLFVGMALGAAMWWVALSLLTAATRGGLDAEAMLVVNWTFVACLLGFGVMSLFSGHGGV